MCLYTEKSPRDSWLMVDGDFMGHSCPSRLDRARVVGGLPDVVAIQEGKVNTF